MPRLLHSGARSLPALLIPVFLSFVPVAVGAQQNGDAATRAPVTPSAGDGDHTGAAPRATAVLLSGEIELDGRLDETVWSTAAPITRFYQREPDEGELATQRTEVRILYDATTLYIGARMFDDRGDAGVVTRLVRRDGNPESDMLLVTLDPFHDHRGTVEFAVNPSGVRGDSFNGDDSWDPVWRARAATDAQGWTAELAIPFSQLRFPRDRAQEWGLQIERRVNRLNERSVWSFWHLNEGGGPSRFGHLDGMEDITARATRLEVLPYAVSQLDVNGTRNEADPFTPANESTWRVGADLKYLLTSNLTLSATVNPDFGQAEVDPAVVNLSAFETFFPEKREFFIEGRSNFSYGNFWCQFCSNVSSLSMLFTRRIGRRPQAGFLAAQAGNFADVPAATTIAGAAKITGRTAKGMSVGVLGALTQREHAPVILGDGSRMEQEVEPRAGYFVGRVKQDFLEGDLQIGGIATSVVRSFEDPALESFMNRDAQSLGVDAEYWWGDRTYHLMFQSAFTRIAGAPEAILTSQTASARYFQRPDREHGDNGLFTDRFDPSLTSMRGWGVYSRIAKDNGDWRWESALNARSPGFENNDLAFLTRADYVWMNGNVVRQWTTPGSWYRQVFATLGGQQQYNFDGDLTDRQAHAHVYTQTPFYWDLSSFVIYRPERLDDRLTRGGPLVRRPPNWFVAGFFSSDSREPVSVGFNPSHGWDDDGGSSLNLGLNVTVRPSSNVRLVLSPSFHRSTRVEQYVTAVSDSTAVDFFGSRYVFADLKQTSVSMTTRLNVTFSPTMSLELFAQPLISANSFRNFKEFEAPRSRTKRIYGVDVGTVRVEQDVHGGRIYAVDPDGAGAAEEFQIADPDFNFRSLRGNAVFRWEYAPGSTLFLVWTQDRSASERVGDLDFGRDRAALFDADSDHVFLVKVSYWLGL